MTRDTLIGGRAGRIQIEGSSVQYEREDGSSVAGEFSVAFLEPGCQCVLLNGRVYRIAPGAPGEVLVNGTPIAVEIFDPRELRGRKSGAAGGGRQEISASMPGKVVRVLVEPGDSVEAGQGLVVVEAMKMQNEMKSPKAGRVVEVRTRADAAVAAGEALIVVE
jgi:biotin carboxyl carrier protein